VRIHDLINSIRPVDKSLAGRIQAHLDDLTKPRGSLGRLETLAARYSLIQGTVQPVLGDKRIVVFAADHGVADEGVSAYPKEVTPQMVKNMLGGGAAVNVLARHIGAELTIVDMGVAAPLEQAQGLRSHKIRAGTDNIANGPAMTDEEAARALAVGADLGVEAAAAGAKLLATGEMGIANTTPAAALMAALLPCPPEEVTGRGTGIDDERLTHKCAIVRKALETNAALCTGPRATLAALGGFEIAGLCGFVLGAAARRIPLVVDGFIATAAALTACRMNEATADYLFFSHCSAESGHRSFFREFGTEPLLDLGMRLGEGTGAALAISLIEAAVKLYNEMATFSSAGVSDRA